MTENYIPDPSRFLNHDNEVISILMMAVIGLILYNIWKDVMTFPMFASCKCKEVISFDLKYVPDEDYPSVRILNQNCKEVPVEIHADLAWFKVSFKEEGKQDFYIFWGNPKAKMRPKNHKYGAINVWKDYKIEHVISASAKRS